MYDKQQQLEDIRRWNREQVQKTQEIAPMPPVVDPARKKRACASFKAFCESYFKDVFYLEWSEIHLQVIEKIERVIRNGECFALAMPRGSGKTTLNQIAVLWAAMTGQTDFVVLIASNANRADALLEDLKVWLETNDTLLEDFPEVCYPVRKLERIAQRQRGQMYNGVKTRINWKASKMVLPTIEGSVASGVCVMTSGMSGSDIRGLSHTRADGRKVRPSLVFVDDPQTRESAQSETQCADREKIIKADILGMAGPGRKMACCITTTVIAENDVAQRLLDRTRNPEFRGERYQLMKSFPKNLDLWEEYRQIREAELLADGDGSQATEFYRQNREAMDEGAQPTWQDRYNVDEISAVQYAMNLKFRDEGAFASEYQNAPVVESLEATEFDATGGAALSGYKRGEIPEESQFLTAFIDVHKNLLYWVVCAWEHNFTGVVVDYDVFPKQRRKWFRLEEAKPVLEDVVPGAGLEGQIYGGLAAVTKQLFEKDWRRSDGVAIPLKRVLIDANWGQTTDTVYQFIQESAWRDRITPSHGKYVGAASKPFSEYAFKRGDVCGPHWRAPNDGQRRQVRRVLVDTNYWKSFVFARLTTRAGDPGRLAFNGAASEHALFNDHLNAEYRTQVTGRGRRVDEWRLRPHRDNHYFDCLVGCCVAASMSGAALEGLSSGIRRTTVKRVSFAEMQRKAQGRSRAPHRR